MGDDTLALFALNATRAFGAAVAQRLGLELTPHEEREFDDGEHKARPLANVRGRDVFVIQSLYADVQDAQVPRAHDSRDGGGRVVSGTKTEGCAGAADPRQSVNDKLVRLLFFLGALRDASAARVTAVVPYLAYARKDAKTQPRDPVTTRYVAALFEAVGTERVVTLDVHNLAAFQNAFRCRTEHLEATGLFVAHFTEVLQDTARVTVVSPDAGGIKRVERLRQALAQALPHEPGIAFLEKARGRGVLRGGRLVGDVAGTSAVILDDLIGTGGTLRHAAQACREAGATRVYAAATHGLFIGPAADMVAADMVAADMVAADMVAADMVAADVLDRVVVTDTIPPFRLDPELTARKLTVLSAAPLFAEAIARIHGGGSLVELLQT